MLLDHLDLISLLIICSAFAGFAAGLFGIGGGAILVPVLYPLFSSMGYTETAMHSALATSLASIIITSLRSVQSHHKRGSVDWRVLKAWTPWIMVGAFFGQLLATSLTSSTLVITFSILAYLLAAQLFFGRSDWTLSSKLPTGLTRSVIGVSIGSVSTLMGIGGGTFGVSLMTLHGHPIQRSVATAAGFGAAIGVPSAVTAMIIGINTEGLPPFSLGYVNILALLVISMLTISVAPIGARVAHSIDPGLLRRMFSILLLCVATYMLFEH